jgi:hypothetical protein
MLALLVPQAILDAVVWQRPRTLWPAVEGNAALQLLGPIGRAYEAALPPVQTDGLTPAVFFLTALLIVASIGLAGAARIYERRDAASSSSGVWS